LRVWADGAQEPCFVPLKDHATAIEGSYGPASAVFTLQVSVTADDYIQVAWLSEHYFYKLTAADSLASAVHALANAINDSSPTVAAAFNDTQLTLTYLGESATPGVRESPENSTTGANGNRLGAYANVSGAQTESWSPAWQYFSGGTSPTKWRISLSFASITYYDQNGNVISNP